MENENNAVNVEIDAVGSVRLTGTFLLLIGLFCVGITAPAEELYPKWIAFGVLLTAVGIGLRIEAAIRGTAMRRPVPGPGVDHYR